MLNATSPISMVRWIVPVTAGAVLVAACGQSPPTQAAAGPAPTAAPTSTTVETTTSTTTTTLVQTDQPSAVTIVCSNPEITGPICDTDVDTYFEELNPTVVVEIKVWAGPSQDSHIGYEGERVGFYGGGSYSYEGAADLYEWDFESDGVFDLAVRSPYADYTYPGEYDGVVTLRVTDDAGNVGIGTAPVLVRGEDPDPDRDGLPIEVEMAIGTDPRDDDTDDDGLPDGAEVDRPAPTDPRNPDTDDDWLHDGAEDWNVNGIVDAGETDPLNPDTDGDGISDGLDSPWLGLEPTNPDTDEDGIRDALDPDMHRALVGLLQLAQGESDLEVYTDGADQALLDVFDAIEQDLQRGDTTSAAGRLESLAERFDGCVDGLPDADDWILDCEAQKVMIEVVEAALAEL